MPVHIVSRNRFRGQTMVPLSWWQFRYAMLHRIQTSTIKPLNKMYKISKLNCFSSHLAIVLAQSIQSRCSVENEGVVGEAPTGYAPTTSEWWRVLVPSVCHKEYHLVSQLPCCRTDFTNVWNQHICPLLFVSVQGQLFDVSRACSNYNFDNHNHIIILHFLYNSHVLHMFLD